MVMVINRRNKYKERDRDGVSLGFTVEAESFSRRQALI